MAIPRTKNSLSHTHDLVAHLRATSELAAGFAEPFGAGEMARLLGLWHDLGKFHPRFQGYLECHDSGKQWVGPSPDHKAAGPIWRAGIWISPPWSFRAITEV